PRVPAKVAWRFEGGDFVDAAAYVVRRRSRRKRFLTRYGDLSLESESRHRDGQSPGTRPAGAGHRDQPRRQGGQGRAPLLVHGPGGGGRRELRGRDRLREGARGAAGDPEGGRERPQEPDP